MNYNFRNQNSQLTEISDINGTFTLNNGVRMPYLGLGVFASSNVSDAVLWAFDAGYRHIDTASVYHNETEVGKAIHKSGLKREKIFVVSKVWNSEQGYDQTILAFEHSLNRLGLDYLDLYLIHWPVKEKYVDTWRALEYLYQQGEVRAIGVSNFLQHHLETLLPHTSITPTVNQMEFHPYLVQQKLLDYCKAHKIQYEAWSPLMKGKVIQLPTMQRLSEKYQKTPVQIVLRWNLQKGVITIPKSEKKERIIANADVFDFNLTDDEVDSIDALDRNHRVGPDPDDFQF